jgi:hypothetical protein
MRGSRFLAAGLFVAAVVLVVEAQPRQPLGGGTVSFAEIINSAATSNPALQDELKLTAEQKKKLQAVAGKRAEMFKKSQALFKSSGGGKEKLQEMLAAMRKENDQLREEIQKALDDTLTADQKKRLKQIDRQMAGIRAFAAEDVQAGLNLSDDQKSKIKGVLDAFQKDFLEATKSTGGSFKGGKIDLDQARENMKKVAAVEKSARSNIEEVLTADQRKQWAEMVGAPFDMNKLFTGFGGPPKGKGKGKE